MKLNLPNRLTMLRCLLVALFLLAITLPENTSAACLISAAVFGIASLTDMLDGRIARRRGLITDFGKFMDPLADKLMVFGALLGILYRFEDIRPVFVWAAFIVIFRELAVTSMRLVVAGRSGEVIAAKWIGKVKTVTQIFAILVILIEPAVPASALPPRLFSYIAMAAMSVMTVWSGVDYLRSYWKYIQPDA